MPSSTVRRIGAPTLANLDDATRARLLDQAADDLARRAGPAIEIRRDGPAVRALAAALARTEHAGAPGARLAGRHAGARA